MQSLLILLSVIIHLSVVDAFITSFLNHNSRNMKLLNMKWDETRPPLPVPSFLEQSMDAAWGRGKFRTEVWDDDVNPMNNWWEIYAPSQEEMDATAKDFDFSNVEEWCTKKGYNFEDVMKKYLEDAENLVKATQQANEQELKSIDMNSFAAEQEKFFKLQKQAFEVAFRKQDDILQNKKGQPSLDDEDDGKQYKNDPVP